MENPVVDIPKVIHGLIQTRPSTQQATVEQFFTPSAAYLHPFCGIPSFARSRWVILKLYQWYKIMSPRIEYEIHSIAYDEKHLRLYVNMSQLFSVWYWPFHVAPVTLTVVMDLTTDLGDGRGSTHNHHNKYYYIRKQEDLYQTSEFIKFLVPYGGHLGVLIIMGFATLASILGVFVFWWIMWAEEKGIIPDRIVKGGNLAFDAGRKIPGLKRK